MSRYKGEKVYELRQKLKLAQAKPNVCGVETKRDLITPGRTQMTQYNVKLTSENSALAILLYL